MIFDVLTGTPKRTPLRLAFVTALALAGSAGLPAVARQKPADLNKQLISAVFKGDTPTVAALLVVDLLPTAPDLQPRAAVR